MNRYMTVFLAVLGAPLAAQYYAATNGWQFDNFKDAVYAWDIYRDTFIGIPPTDDPWSSAFDYLFYDQLYKAKLSENGNCFGMSLQSLMMLKKGGHLGFCLPISQYSGDIFGAGTGGEKLGPTDSMLKRAINIMHGHQVNLPTVQLMLSVVSQGRSRDGSFAYSAYQSAQAQSDLTVVSITKTWNPSDGGHTMVAYGARDLGGGSKRIYVYDPKRTWADPSDGTWYQNGQNYIQVTGTAWSFLMASGTTWSGDPASGGNIMIMPISLTGPHSRSPASLGLQIIGQILTSLVITGAGAEVEQVTDAAGKRLYLPGTRNIDTNPATGMMTMMPFYPSGQSTRRSPPGMLLINLGRSGSTLHVKVKGGDSGYAVTAGALQHLMTVRAAGGNGADVISFHQAGTPSQSVEVLNQRGTSEYEVHLMQADPAAKRLRGLRLSRAALPQGAWLRAAAEDSHRALSVSAGGPLRYDLELRSTSVRGTSQLTRKAVFQEKGTESAVRPRDWQNLQIDEVLEIQRPVTSTVSRR